MESLQTALQGVVSYNYLVPSHTTHWMICVPVASLSCLYHFIALRLCASLSISFRLSDSVSSFRVGIPIVQLAAFCVYMHARLIKFIKSMCL